VRKAYPPGDAHKYAEATAGIAMRLRGKRVDDRLEACGTFCKLQVELTPDGALRPREWMVVARQGYYRK